MLGGAILGSQTTMGVYQLRPVTVRHFIPVLNGRNVSEMTDREVALALLDTQVNIESFATIYRAIIDDVEKRRLTAVSGQDPLEDVNHFLQGAKGETETYYVWHPTQAKFAQLPPRALMGENDWLLAIYHPLRYKFLPNLRDMTFSLLSGLLDETPNHPVIDVADTEEDLAKLVGLESHPDPYISAAAKRTVDRMLDGPRGNLLRELREKVRESAGPSPLVHTNPLASAPSNLADVGGNFMGKVYTRAEAKPDQMVTGGIEVKINKGQVVFTHAGQPLYTKDGNPAKFPLANNQNGQELWSKAKQTLLVYLENNEEIKKRHPDFTDFVKTRSFDLHIIEDNDFVQGYSDGTTMVLTPLALSKIDFVLHEIGEAYFASGSTHTNYRGVLAHTYPRGVGFGVLRSLERNFDRSPEAMILPFENKGCITKRRITATVDFQ